MALGAGLIVSPPTKRNVAKEPKTVTKADVGAKAKANRGTSPIDAATNITQRIATLADWRGAMLARVRALIHEADPAIVEEWKWTNPVWSRDGIVCTGESYRQAVKLTFPRGAALADPQRIFNASLEGGTRRAIDLREDAAIDEDAFRALIRAAIAANAAALAERTKKK